jgi:hypothetical protein
MLRKLLDIIRAGELSSQPEIARQLGVSVDMLNALIEQLVRMGYLQDLNQACDTASSCAHCDLSAACKKPAIRMWQLTEKGRQGL